MSKKELIDIAVQIKGETKYAYRIYDGKITDWVPKSQVEMNDDNTYNAGMASYRKGIYLMANRIIYRSWAEDYFTKNGWKLFLDLIINQRYIVFEDEVKEDADDGLPIGFEFPYSKYKDICELIAMLNKQGFKVTK